jgi:hypothetical protein
VGFLYGREAVCGPPIKGCVARHVAIRGGQGMLEAGTSEPISSFDTSGDVVACGHFAGSDAALGGGVIRSGWGLADPCDFLPGAKCTRSPKLVDEPDFDCWDEAPEDFDADAVAEDHQVEAAVEDERMRGGARRRRARHVQRMALSFKARAAANRVPRQARPQWAGHAPRPACNARRRGSRRVGAGSRAGPDDPEDGEPAGGRLLDELTVAGGA